MRPHDILPKASERKEPPPPPRAKDPAPQRVSLSKLEVEVVFLLRASGELFDRFYEMCIEGGEESKDVLRGVVLDMGRGVEYAKQLKNKFAEIKPPSPLERQRIDLGISFLDRLIDQEEVIRWASAGLF